jgi:hypothetical protein
MKIRLTGWRKTWARLKGGLEATSSLLRSLVTALETKGVIPLGLVRIGLPLVLTEEGKKVLQDSGFNDIFAQPDSRGKIIELVKAMKLASSYDAQEISRKVMVSLRDDLMFSRIKEFAFEEGLDLISILVAFRVGCP